LLYSEQNISSVLHLWSWTIFINNHRVKRNRIILDRSSYDFCNPKWHLLEVQKVPSVYRGLRLVYFYDDDREFDVSQELQIEY